MHSSTARRGRYLPILSVAAVAFVLTACPAATQLTSEPTPTRAATPTAEATEAPTDEPTPRPTERGSASGSPDEQLLAHVPEDFRGSCEVAEGLSAMLDAVATVRCEPDEGADSVLYGLYDDEDVMFELFLSWPSEVTLEELEAGTCEDDPPSLSTYSNTDADESSGYILCLPAGDPFADVAELSWTDDELLIRAEAQREDGDLTALYDWWATGAPGPVAAESGGAGSGGHGGGGDEVVFPTAEEEELLSHVPESFRDTCERPDGMLPPGDPGRDPDLIAMVDCFPEADGASEVGFTQYGDTAAMDDAFDQVIDFFAVSEGECAEGDPAYGPYSIGEETVGRVLCAQQALGETGAVMHWTDERLDIKAYAASDDPEIATLYEWWTGDSGPIE